jgi:hypothetical protein
MQFQTPWIERTFDFNLPQGALPNVIERLRGAPARLEEAVKGLGAAALTAKAGNAWSVQEHAGHYADLEILHLGRLDDFEAGAEKLRPADMQNKATVNASHNENDINALLRSFRELRMQFVKRVEGMGPGIMEMKPIHPRLNKPMRLIDMCMFLAEHDDHHLAIINRLKNQ